MDNTNEKNLNSEEIKAVQIEFPSTLRGCHTECHIVNGIYYCKIVCDF